ncbi:MAG: metallophosphoesterase family protein [Solirubrobacteraceae bacterium]
MPIRTTTKPAEPGECRIRIAAAGDVHYGRDGDGERAREEFAGLAGRVDLILLAGDLTTHGEPDQAEILAAAVRDLGIPVIAVLGNHDWHSGRGDEVRAVLERAGVVVLDRSHHVLELCGAEVGVAGTKGFVGGFAGSHLPDFGEPLLRSVYAEGMAEVAAPDEGLRAIALCPFRIALLHYAPTSETLEGERRDIWTFLGTTAWRRRSSSTTPTSCCTGTPTRAPSRAAWARSRSTTSPRRSCARTSGSSS